VAVCSRRRAPPREELANVPFMPAEAILVSRA
jgi:hypothetical protein